MNTFFMKENQEYNAKKNTNNLSNDCVIYHSFYIGNPSNEDLKKYKIHYMKEQDIYTDNGWKAYISSNPYFCYWTDGLVKSTSNLYEFLEMLKEHFPNDFKILLFNPELLKLDY